MRMNYKPVADLEKCPWCGRMIVILRGRLKVHHPKRDSKARDSLCKGSNKVVKELKNLVRNGLDGGKK